jgi:hypothetical protein
MRTSPPRLDWFQSCQEQFLEDYRPPLLTLQGPEIVAAENRPKGVNLLAGRRVRMM